MGTQQQTMQPALFYVNGVMEGMFGMTVLRNPGVIMNGAEMHKDGIEYSRLFAPMFVTSCFVSTLLAKQPDNTAKQLFGVVWMVYHANAVMRTAGAIMKKPVNATIGINVFHIAMTVWFAYYLKKSGFRLKTLSPM